MPKNPGLKLFTKTWPMKNNKKSDEVENRRPLTATLEKPTILDIRFITKIDMSVLRKEFLNISNLCRMPLIIKSRATTVSRPLSLMSTDTFIRNSKKKKKRKKTDQNDDSHEDDESSVIQSAKIIKSRLKLSGPIKSSVISNNMKSSSVLAIKNSDANNNKPLKVSVRKPTLGTIRISSPKKLTKSPSTKLPSPCKTCGRPDLPERFHSHPATGLKSPRKSEVKMEKIPVKSTVQKPIAIRYKSKTPVLPEKRKPTLIAKPEVIPPKSASSIVKDLRGGSAQKRTLTCYICAREFGTASLSLHEPNCLKKWERENASLPPSLRRKAPIKPENNLSQQEWNKQAWANSQASLVPCKNCRRTFYPDRLEVHQRSCRVPLNLPKKSSSNDTLSSTTSLSRMSQNSDPPSSATSTKSNAVHCYICGKPFGNQSIKIHERQCLKKWHVENESLPHDMRGPAPLRPANQKTSSHSIRSPTELPKSSTQPTSSTKDERPTSGGSKSPLFPCYLCGKLFTVNSIYIHEPQCLKSWKIENDKLPLSKRRAIPLKPDIKFTQSGKLNIEATSQANWQTHLSQLVPCKVCSRTFNPDRVAVHERSCKGI